MPYGNQCRWCGRTIDLPIGDECSKCEDRLNRVGEITDYEHPTAPRDIAAYYEGCTLRLLEDAKPCTRIEWGWNATEERVRADLKIFFSYGKRIQIDRLTWDGEPRKG